MIIVQSNALISSTIKDHYLMSGDRHSLKLNILFVLDSDTRRKQLSMCPPFQSWLPNPPPWWFNDSFPVPWPRLVQFFVATATNYLDLCSTFTVRHLNLVINQRCPRWSVVDVIEIKQSVTKDDRSRKTNHDPSHQKQTSFPSSTRLPRSSWPALNGHHSQVWPMWWIVLDSTGDNQNWQGAQKGEKGRFLIDWKMAAAVENELCKKKERNQFSFLLHSLHVPSRSPQCRECDVPKWRHMREHRGSEWQDNMQEGNCFKESFPRWQQRFLLFAFSNHQVTDHHMPTGRLSSHPFYLATVLISFWSGSTFNLDPQVVLAEFVDGITTSEDWVEWRTETRMVSKKVSMIAAVCQGNGIGIKGNLPWRLKNEMAYFTRITSETKDGDKKNAVVMGRKSWDSIPPKYRPLPGRVNVVISRSLPATGTICGRPIRGRGVEFQGDEGTESNQNAQGNNGTNLPAAPDLVFSSLVTCLTFLDKSDEIESIFIIGGQQLYELGIQLPVVTRIYLTRIHSTFECDTFFPELSTNQWLETTLPSVPTEEQEEKGIKYNFHVFERTNYQWNKLSQIVVLYTVSIRFFEQNTCSEQNDFEVGFNPCHESHKTSPKFIIDTSWFEWNNRIHSDSVPHKYQWSLECVGHGPGNVG